MSESEKKETTAPSHEQGDYKFEEAVKKGSYAEAFDIIKDGTTARVDKILLEHVAAIRGCVLPAQYEAIIQHVSKEGLFNLEEFLDIIKLLEKPGEENQKEKIYEKLQKAEERKGIVLYGEEGVGKTWMAREVANLAVRKGDFDVAIWVYLDRIYEDFSLRESIAYQLCVLAEFEEYEAEEAKKKNKKEKADESKKKKKVKAVEEKEKVEEAKRKKKKIESLIKDALNGKKLLLILDGQGSRILTAKVSVVVDDDKKSSGVDDGQKGEEERDKSSIDESGKEGEEKTKQNKADKKEEEKINVVLELMDAGVVKARLELGCLKSYKSVITRKEVVDDHEAGDDSIMVKPFTWKDANRLASQVMERERVDKSEEVGELIGYFILRSTRLPAPLLLISRIVSYFVKKEELHKLRNYRELLNKGKGLDVLDVLIKGYERLPKSVLIDLYSPEMLKGNFLHQGRNVNYNELICYWIMEGLLGHFDRVEEAYMEGHRVLMELMNCGLLQKQEADFVVAASGAIKFNLDIHDYKDFFRGLRSGMGVTFDMSLGKVAVADGMIKTMDEAIYDDENSRGLPRKENEHKIISTLLLDGNRIGVAKPPAKLLGDHIDHVEVLAITDPTTQHFRLPILEMQKLRLLALRGCQFLDMKDSFLKTIDHHPQKILEGLKFLEISGPTSLEPIPDKLFELTPNLRTLNMSYLRNVKELPESFYRLTQIEFLILRGCESLIELKSLNNFKDLKLLDVSEATNFEKFLDKSLHSNSKLQVINLSKTKLKTLPLMNQLSELKYVWLSDCAKLPRIRKLDRLQKLQIFDISGAAEVERFCDPSLEDLKSLVIVDISRTAIKRLPANIGDPIYLYVKDCHRLRVVPPVEGINRLQVLHLSGCVRLREVRKEFFATVEGLRELDLSKTSVVHLDFLSSLHSLRTLLLSGCESLNKLEKLGDLQELEFLDLTGCRELKELEDGSFDKMTHLQRLYLSGTGLGGQKPLPSLSNLKNLKELLARDCPNLTNLPGVEQVPNLEVLDCSGTVLESPLPFSDRDKHPRGPRVDGAGIESINTSQLIKSIGATQQSVDLVAKWNFKYNEVSECKWNISNWRIEATNDEEKLGVPVHGVHFIRLLKEYPSFFTENLSTFRLLVYPSKSRFPDDFRGFYIDELRLRDVYFKQICEEKMERCLEIRGFEELPKSLRPLIARAEFIVLVDDSFLKSLLDLGVDRSMAMKACWIESCNELEHVVAAAEIVKETKKTEEAAKGDGDQHKKIAAEKSTEAAKSKDDQMNKAATEKLAKSKGDQQKIVTKEKTREDKQLKSDAAEKIEESTKSEGDQQKNDAGEKLGESTTKSESNDKKNDAEEKSVESTSKSEGDQQKNVVEKKMGDSTTKSEGDEKKNDVEEKSGESTAKSEGDEKKNAAAESSGDQMKSDDVAAAEKSGDQHKNVDASKSGDGAKTEGDQQNKVGANKTKDEAETKLDKQSKNPAEDLDKLESLWISDISKLKSVCKGDIQSVSFKFLKSLYLEYCPELIEICSSSSQLQTLETLHIKYCHKLKALFTDDKPSKMEKLRKLQLWGLDSLEKIDCKAPLLYKLRVGECPLLEHVIASRLPEAEADDAIKHETEGHHNLDTLHIKSCNKLKSIFESPHEDVHFEKLTILELLGLPKLKKVAQAAPLLRVLKVGDCPSLESIINSSANQVPNLETMEVKSCEKMKTIIEGGGGISKLEKIKKIELDGLPELESIGAQLPNGETCKPWACPKFKFIKDDA